ncbi:hypothetical protein AB7076_17260, partial [Providencia rettgeri]
MSIYATRDIIFGFLIHQESHFEAAIKKVIIQHRHNSALSYQKRVANPPYKLKDGNLSYTLN